MLKWLNRILSSERLEVITIWVMALMFVVMVSSYIEMCHYRTLWWESNEASHISTVPQSIQTPRISGNTSKASLLNDHGNIKKVKHQDVQIVEIKVSTLAIKNKNPLNVKCLGGNKKWKGQIGKDKIGHAIFRTWEDGIRAAAFVLKNYEAKYGINTIEDIVTRFAKAKGGVKDEYIGFLCRRMKLEPDEEFSIRRRLPELLKHMTRFESGQDFPDRFFRPYDLVSAI